MPCVRYDALGYDCSVVLLAVEGFEEWAGDDVRKPRRRTHSSHFIVQSIIKTFFVCLARGTKTESIDGWSDGNRRKERDGYTDKRDRVDREWLMDG